MLIDQGALNALKSGGTKAFFQYVKSNSPTPSTSSSQEAQAGINYPKTVTASVAINPKIVNVLNKSPTGRKILQRIENIHPEQAGINYPKTVPIAPKIPTTASVASILSKSAAGRSILERLEKMRSFKPSINKEEMNIYQFKTLYPEILVPSSKYGDYDVVTVKTRKHTGIDGKIDTSFLFSYSPVAKHKIKVAGSVENYDKYLSIVRNNYTGLILTNLWGPSLNLDIALASNKPGITGASEREEIFIKKLHKWKGSPESKGDIRRMWTVAIPESLPVQMSLSAGGGLMASKVLGGAGGYVAARWGPKALQAFKIAELAGGSAIVAPKAYDITQKAYQGKYKEAIPEALSFGLNLAAGIEGYNIGKSSPKIFGKYKGLTPYEAGFKKGLVKSKIYDPFQKEYYNLLYDIKQDLRLRNVNPVQQEPTYTNVEALQKYNQQKANVLRNVIKNQLIALRNRAQISGGAGTEKVSTHDIDELFRSAKDPIVLEYIARKLGIDPSMVFDPHQLPGTGKIIDITGTPKETPYVYPSGQRGIRLTEQFYRLGGSSANLAHEGRIKDIPEARRLLDLIYNKTGGVPVKMQPKIQRFFELSAILESDPRVMDPAMNQLLYNSGIGKKLWNIRTRFYKKVLPDTYLEKQFNILSNKDLAVLQNYLEIGYTRGLPPSLSMIFGSSDYIGASGLSTFLSSNLGSIPSSYMPGRSSMLVSRSRSKKPSSYPSGSKSKSRQSTSIVSYPVSPPYSPPSSPPSSPPYYPPSSPPYSPPSSPPYSPPPDVLWFPGLGGKVASKGRADPYFVRYIDEYEMMQKLMNEVIL